MFARISSLGLVTLFTLLSEASGFALGASVLLNSEASLQNDDYGILRNLPQTGPAVLPRSSRSAALRGGAPAAASPRMASREVIVEGA